MSKTIKLTLAAAALITAATLAAPAAMAHGKGGDSGGGGGPDSAGSASAPLVLVDRGDIPRLTLTPRHRGRKFDKYDENCTGLIPVLEADIVEVEKCERRQ